MEDEEDSIPQEMILQILDNVKAIIFFLRPKMQGFGPAAATREYLKNPLSYLTIPCLILPPHIMRPIHLCTCCISLPRVKPPQEANKARVSYKIDTTEILR